ncbi:MAG: hypothetical protein ACLR4Z_06560 [Butyricicoccaceae bacterium]
MMMGDRIARNALHRSSKNMTGGIGWHNISPFQNSRERLRRPAQTDFPQAPANSITCKTLQNARKSGILI